MKQVISISSLLKNSEGKIERWTEQKYCRDAKKELTESVCNNVTCETTKSQSSRFHQRNFPGFRIPHVKISRIPESGFPSMVRDLSISADERWSLIESQRRHRHRWTKIKCTMSPFIEGMILCLSISCLQVKFRLSFFSMRNAVQTQGSYSFDLFKYHDFPLPFT